MQIDNMALPGKQVSLHPFPFILLKLSHFMTGDLLNAIETLQLYGCGKTDLSLLNARKGKKVRLESPCKPEYGSLFHLQSVHKLRFPIVKEQKFGDEIHKG